MPPRKNSLRCEQRGTTFEGKAARERERGTERERYLAKQLWRLPDIGLEPLCAGVQK